MYPSWDFRVFFGGTFEMECVWTMPQRISVLPRRTFFPDAPISRTSAYTSTSTSIYSTVVITVVNLYKAVFARFSDTRVADIHNLQ